MARKIKRAPATRAALTATIQIRPFLSIISIVIIPCSMRQSVAQRRSAFTLIELMVVIGIIFILAGILFSAFAQAKAAGKKSVCLTNLAQTGMAMQLYLADFDSRYPQTRKNSAQPEVDDAGGALEEPDFGSAFTLLDPYIKANGFLKCAEDLDSAGTACDQVFPDHAEVNSYLINGYFVFGLSESGVAQPASTVMFAERRSQGTTDAYPYCNYLYRPWFNLNNGLAPEDDMHPTSGAIATGRHAGRSVYAFADTHVKNLAFDQTFTLSGSVNLHLVD